MKILLTGANGFIGKHITSALLSNGHDVIPLSRHHGNDFNHMLNPEDWMPHLHGVDAVINSVGIIAETHGQTFANIHHHAPAALFHACLKANVKRVVQISALGADEHAFTPFQLSKKAADDILRSLPLDWFVLRPSLVYGQGGKSTTMFRRLSMLPVIPRIGSGKQYIQPVHIIDLIATVVQCIQSTQAQRTLDIVGAYPLTLIEWLQTMRKSNGKAAAPTIPIAFNLAIAITQLTKFFMPLLHHDNLRMLQQGNTSDHQPLTEFLGRSLRNVTTDDKDDKK